jgi:hypothetical protein
MVVAECLRRLHPIMVLEESAGRLPTTPPLASMRRTARLSIRMLPTAGRNV